MKTKVLLTFFLFPILLSCSKQDSEKVEINFIPEDPKVKFADGKIQTGTDASTLLPVYEIVEAPWFKFRITIQNGADKNLVVESLVLKLSGLTTTSGIVTATSTITAESTIVASDVLLPTVIASVTAGTTSTESLEFYVSGLPTAVTSGVYNVEVQANGWFGTENDPVSVFSQKYFFTTR